MVPAKKKIMRSRSFGIPVGNYVSLAESITLYGSRADEKLRKQLKSVYKFSGDSLLESTETLKYHFHVGNLIYSSCVVA